LSTYLELVQALHTEAGASGQAPTAVTGLRGEHARLAKWIKDANIYIQELWEDWKFRREQYSEDTTVGSKLMPAANPLAAFYDAETFRILFAGDTFYNPIDAVEYSDIKSEVPETDNLTPSRIVIMPDGTIELDAPADDVHTITCDYYQQPVELVNANDVSIIPARFHRIIVARALVLYGNFENAADAKTQGAEMYAEILARLENSELPNKNKARFRNNGSFEVIAE
jgi:hypothetical protein